MTTTDLKPGDFVQHPERRLNGLVVNGDGESIRILHLTSLGVVTTTSNLTGWERVETCTTEAARILEDYQQIVSKSAGVIVRDAVVMMTPAVYEAHHGRETIRPGHVQVRVDDLDLSHWLNKPDGNNIWGESARVAIRAANAIAAQRAESTSPVDEPDASATEAATYQCPWCSTDVTFALSLNRNPRGGVMVWVAADGGHTCPPAQPDEPTEFGARVTVTLPDGTREKWCRLGKHHPAPWLGETYDVPGEAWSLLCRRGTVTLGWYE